MAKYRIVKNEFWKNPIVLDEMTPEDKLFYVYLLTNPSTTQIGIYQISKKQIACDLGYSMETVQALMVRFINHHQLIRYNPETREIAIKNWGRENLEKGGKPVMDCILTELKEVEDHSLIQYVSASIRKQEIRSLYESFCKQVFDKEDCSEAENDTYSTDCEGVANPEVHGQIEKQPTIPSNGEGNSDIENPFYQKSAGVKEIIEFWDGNGFGFSNVNAKEQLLAWLDDSSFLDPKSVILKAMQIACANNKRKLNYIVGILRNWENESLLTVEEIDFYQENQKPLRKSGPSAKSVPGGRAIPDEFVLDLTAGEEE